MSLLGSLQSNCGIDKSPYLRLIAKVPNKARRKQGIFCKIAAIYHRPQYVNATIAIPNNMVTLLPTQHSQWASYQIRNIAGCACAGNAGNVFPRRRLQRKPLVSDPGMHHGTCVTHVLWCMSGSLASGGGESVPGIPGACAPAIFRIW